MKSFLITALALLILISASACSNEQTVETPSSEQASLLIESNNSELTMTSEISSNSTTTSSKSAVTSRETTTMSKAKLATSSEKVSTSSKKVWIREEIDVGDFEFNFSSSDVSQSSNVGTYRFMFAEEMCDAPELKSQIEQLNETYKELGLRVSLEGDGQKIIFVYKFTNQIDASAIKDQLEEALKSQKEVFNLQVVEMQKEVMTEVFLGIKYVNADGTVICEAEFPQ